MSLPFHLVPGLDGVRPGGTVTVTGEEAHHAVAVRRLRRGERLALTDGRGTVALGVVRDTARNELTVEVTDVRADPEPDPRLVVVQALPKGDRGELAVSLLTEVGVARIVPWSAARSVTVWRGERGQRALARWRATAREAAKQARRPWLPEVTGLATTADLAAVLAAADLAVVLHEAADTRLGEVSLPAASAGAADAAEVVVVVGPEGGLTEAELAGLGTAGAVPVRLGAEVLRTSTAGLAACAALLARSDRWLG